MKKLLFIFCLLVLSFAINAQETEDKTARNTIHVQKSGHLAKAMYDNVNYRLVAIDQYGNILDSAVQSFTVKVTIKGIFSEENVVGNYLSPKMQQQLGKRDANGSIFFSNIKAKDRSGEVVELRSIQAQIGYLREDGE